ncbi:MAG: DUF6261 family protein [Paludibacter sp.]
MNYRSKTNKSNIMQLSALVLRLIDTVIASGIQAAKVTKRFLHLVDVSLRYQAAITLDQEESELKKAVKAKYDLRSELFNQMYNYLEGSLNSPDTEMKAAANVLFQQVNRFGKNFSKAMLLVQTAQYVTIIAAVKRSEFAAALVTTLLTEKLSALDQAQADYELLYTGITNRSSVKVVPSDLRKELTDAIKEYMDEVNLMASQVDTPEWNSLCVNLQNRFDEVNLTVAQKTKTEAPAKDASTTPAA